MFLEKVVRLDRSVRVPKYTKNDGGWKVKRLTGKWAQRSLACKKIVFVCQDGISFVRLSGKINWQRRLEITVSSTNLLSSAPPSGMRDFVPRDAALRDWAQSVILSTYERFGFARIETPALENISLLRKGEGGENLQLIFEVLKRGEKLERELRSTDAIKREELCDLGLRFDLTVPLVRFYAHNQGTLPNPLKSIQIGSVWRAESPQAGRYRQFTQCDIDIIGVKSEVAETELIQATAAALIALGFKDFTVRINDRRILTELAEFCEFSEDRFETVFIALDKLDKIGIEGVRRELNAVAHSGEATDRLISILETLQSSGSFSELRSALPSTTSSAVFTALERVIETITQLSKNGYKIRFDPTLVRGMGYYTGQIFEIATAGYSYSIAGGGRYDKMVGKFSGRDVAACGFSLGFERIITILTDLGVKPPVVAEKVALIFEADRDTPMEVLTAADRLRANGSIVSAIPKRKDLKKQLDALMAQDFGHYCILRQNTESLEVKLLAGQSK